MMRLTIPAEHMKILEQERFSIFILDFNGKWMRYISQGWGLPRHEMARLLCVTEGIVALKRFNPHPHSACW